MLVRTFACFVCLLIVAPVIGQDSYTLRILTYNIYHGETTDGRIDMDLFASIINEVKPDLVALQEVDKNTTRTGVVDITEELARRTGLKGYFVKHRDFQGGEYGNAILSRLPVTGVESLEARRVTPQGLTFAFVTVQLAPDVNIVFNSTHLSTNIENRKMQAEQVLEYCAALPYPVIVTGDLNAEPQHDEIKRFLEVFAEADTTYTNTFSTRTGLRKKIDFILYPRNAAWKVEETRVMCREDASDHCAFFAVLTYTPEKRSKEKHKDRHTGRRRR